jgi:hypothetical protein
MALALDDLPPLQRGRIMAAAADRLVPKPRLESDELSGITSPELIDEAIAQAKRAAKVHEGDTSLRAQTKVLRLLTKWMSRQLLPPGKEKEARERLGTRGSLDLKAYRIAFGDDFDDESKQTGIQRAEVREAISDADAYQHFRPLSDDETELVSLIAARRNGPMTLHTLLVETRRKKDVLTVCNAWRVFQTDVALSEGRSPLDILRAFLMIYGLEFLFAGHGPTRLVVHEAIPIPPVPLSPERFVQEGHILKLLEVRHQGPLPPFHMSAHMRLSPLGAIEVQLLYVVNIQRYREDLRRHGLRV